MSHARILVADDEPDIRLMVTRMLGKDYLVLEAANGNQAVSLARLHKPDLVLMDIMMPEKDGYSACAAIKSDPDTKCIPVIMVTGIDHQLNIKLSEEMGADGYITKPFSLDELLNVVTRYVQSTG
ncbi:MAG: response regulator [Chloroflexi bacterium]|nr:response regulator [Chloroflexota bacterium]